MNNTRKIIALFAVASCFSTAVFAQEQEQKPQPPEQKPEKREMPTVEEEARQKAEMMYHELNLDEKQYKKVLSLFESHIKKERELREEARPEGFPEGGFPEGGFPGGGPGGQGGPGGGPGMGGGMPPMGGGPGGGPGGPGGQGGPGMGGGRPPMGPPDMQANNEEMEKLYDKTDKKLQKILTEEQYAKWRSKHQKPQPPMPDVELK